MNKKEATKQHILERAFDMIYQNGYQATSIDKIIKTTQVTKGAFYYHFKNKDEMGIAVITEIINPALKKGLLAPLKDTLNPIESIYNSIEQKLLKSTIYRIDNGCPTNNLVQEMSAVNLKFYKALRNVLDTWINAIQRVLEEGKQHGKIRIDLNSKTAAEFIVASYEGTKGLGKIYGKEIYKSYLNQLKIYLATLK